MGLPISYERWLSYQTDEQLEEWYDNEVDLWEEYESYCADIGDMMYDEMRDERMMEDD